MLVKARDIRNHYFLSYVVTILIMLCIFPLYIQVNTLVDFINKETMDILAIYGTNMSAVV